MAPVLGDVTRCQVLDLHLPNRAALDPFSLNHAVVQLDEAMQVMLLGQGPEILQDLRGPRVAVGRPLVTNV